jgi:hypothetical protein
MHLVSVKRRLKYLWNVSLKNIEVGPLAPKMQELAHSLFDAPP